MVEVKSTMDYLWLHLSLVCAFSIAISDALIKKHVTQDNELFFAWARFSYTLPLMWLSYIVCRHSGVEEKSVVNVLMTKEVYWIFVFMAPLEIGAIILYTKALRVSPLSLTLPFLSFTPMYILIFWVVFLDEKLNITGTAGITFIVVGSYVLSLEKKIWGKEFFSPFIAIYKEKGSIMMIIVAMIYSITASVIKIGIETFSVLSFSTIYVTFIVLTFTPVVLFQQKGKLNTSLLKQAIYPSVFFYIMFITNLFAFSMQSAAYVTSIKRLSLLIGILIGYLFFKEKNITSRLTGSIIIFIGFILIVNSQN